MALKEMTENVEVVQTLSDYPNQEEGLSAEELKAKFDQGPKALKEYLNNVLVPAVQAIQNAMDAGEQYGLDTTLSVPGRAADAGAVGAALAGKAPAGYGLGEIGGEYVDNINIVRNGWYRITPDTVGGNGAYSVVRVDAFDKNNVHQTAYSGLATSAGFIVQKRVCFKGVWGKWEYENPHMVAGYEYRTTERWNGKAVYTMLVDLGITPTNNEKGVYVSLTNPDRVLECRWIIGCGSPIGSSEDVFYGCYISLNNYDSLHFSFDAPLCEFYMSFRDSSAYYGQQAYAVIKYTQAD